MKEMADIKKYIRKQVEKLPTSGNSVSKTDAEDKASTFLVVVAKLTNWKHERGELLLESNSLERAVYAATISQSGAKNITEKKVEAEANEAYSKSRERLESIENDISYLKTYIDIFNNAHIFYRTLAKGE